MERVVEKTYISNLEERCTVKFSEQCIFTTITSTASVVDEWISETRRIYGQITIVGLDTEWCLPKKKGKCGPVAIIQLCVGTRCLIFQLNLAKTIPESLQGFLADPTIKFVGVAVAGDAQKLWDEYGLIVGSTEDLAAVAAMKLGEEKLKAAGLKRLASTVLGVEMLKPKQVILSTWNAKALFYSALRCSCKMIIDNDGSGNLVWAINNRLGAFSFHIKEYYWLDMKNINDIYRYKTQEYSHNAINKFNIYPEQIPAWLVEWVPDEGGYLIGNLQPAHVDFRFFSLGNIWAVASSLATPRQAQNILSLIENKWDYLIGEMPLKICYPALEYEEWRIITGSDPKNTSFYILFWEFYQKFYFMSFGGHESL